LRTIEEKYAVLLFQLSVLKDNFITNLNTANNGLILRCPILNRHDHRTEQLWCYIWNIKRFVQP